MDKTQVIGELRRITTEAESIGPYLEGNLLKGKMAKYVRKDGVVSAYATDPVLQYKAGHGIRKSKRIPKEKVPVVERMLDAGKRRKALMERHRDLSSVLALDLKKKQFPPSRP